MTLNKKKKMQDLIKDLCLIPGLSGYEDKVRKYLERKLDENKLAHYNDVLGNLICTIPGKTNFPSVMLFAHMDQLGFIVKKIENNGFIRVERLGLIKHCKTKSSIIFHHSSSSSIKIKTQKKSSTTRREEMVRLIRLYNTDRKDNLL